MLECMPIYDVFLFCSKLFAPFRGKVVQKWPIWGHHTQIHRFYGIKRWNTMRKKISDPYKPRKKCSRHAHESIKPCLYGTGALEVGAEKKSELVFFISKRALGGPPYCFCCGVFVYCRWFAPGSFCVLVLHHAQGKERCILKSVHG